jgi:internalin A
MLRHQGGSSESPLDLNHLHPLLGSLQQPRAIFMAGVSLQSLPECVAGLRTVQALHFHAAHHINEEALACMATLTDLRHLGLVHCRGGIPAFPAALTVLVHLTSLELCGHLLTREVLEGVCDLTTLEQLNLSTTVGYSTLPDSISKLVGLRVLLMLGTHVSSLPEGMTALTGLQVLSWTCFGATAPLQLEVVWGLKSLNVLFFLDEYMAALPEAVGQLSNLQLLGVCSRALAMVPDSLTTMVTLSVLRLEAPQLHMLPEGLTALTRLDGLVAPGVVLQQQPPAVRSFLGQREAQGCSLELAPDDSSSE